MKPRPGTVVSMVILRFIALAVLVALIELSGPAPAADAGTAKAGSPITLAGAAPAFGWTFKPLAASCAGGPNAGNVNYCDHGATLSNGASARGAPLYPVANEAFQIVRASVLSRPGTPLGRSQATASVNFSRTFAVGPNATTVVLTAAFNWNAKVEDAGGQAVPSAIWYVDDANKKGVPALGGSVTGKGFILVVGTSPGNYPAPNFETPIVKKATLPPGTYTVTGNVAVNTIMNDTNVLAEEAAAQASLRLTVNDLVGELTAVPDPVLVGNPIDITLKNAGAYAADMAMTKLTVTRPNGTVDTHPVAQLPGATGGPAKLGPGQSFNIAYPGAIWGAGANVNAPGTYLVSAVFDDSIEVTVERLSECLVSGECVGGTVQLLGQPDDPREDASSGPSARDYAAPIAAAVAVALALGAGGWYLRRRLSLARHVT